MAPRPCEFVYIGGLRPSPARGRGHRGPRPCDTRTKPPALRGQSSVFCMKHLAQFQRSRGSSFVIAGVVMAILCAGTIAYAESAPNLEVHIANNGFVLIRNATITSISGTTIEAEIAWGSSTLTWEVQTDGKTEFVLSSGEKGTLSGLTESDIITITGELDPTLTEPTVIAETVRTSGSKTARPVVALGVAAGTGGDAGVAAPKTHSNGLSVAGGILGLGLILSGGFIALRSQKGGAVRMLSYFAHARKRMRVSHT